MGWLATRIALILLIATGLVFVVPIKGAATNCESSSQTASYLNELATERRKVVVAHSQGNLFANGSHEILFSDPRAETARLARAFGIVGVATPKPSWITRRSFSGRVVASGSSRKKVRMSFHSAHQK